MEVLSARMAPAFKGDESWKYKRVFENKLARQSEAKMEPRSDTALHYESVPLRESGYGKVCFGGPNGWEGGRRPLVGRPLVRPPLEAVKIENGFSRKVEKPQELSEDLATSEEAQPDDCANSGDEEPTVREEVAEAPQKWPIIQIVDPPPWLPEGWTAVLRTRESGSKDKYYVDPVSQRRFRSKTEVNYFLQTGKSYRYKRNLALLTKPLKEDPVSLPNTGSGRSASLDAASGGDATYGSPSRGYGVGAIGSVRSAAIRASDFRSGTPSSHADIMPRKAHGKPGSKAKVKIIGEESGRLLTGLLVKRNAINGRKAAVEDVQCQDTENRGKLILKLKRKFSEHDDGQRDGKKLRPFEVVGPTPMAQARSRITISDEDEKSHRNSRGVDLTGEISFRSTVPHSLVPSTHVSKRPMSKAPLAPWHFQGQASLFGRPPFGAASHLPSGGANGQGHVLERTSGSSTVTCRDAEAAKAPNKRESPAEQLQRLGRKLCQQSVYVLACEYPGMNTVEEVSLALHAAVSNRPAPHGLTANFNRMFNPGFQALPLALPSAPYHHHAPLTGKMRGSLVKEKGVVPIQKFALDHRYLVAPQAHCE